MDLDEAVSLVAEDWRDAMAEQTRSARKWSDFESIAMWLAEGPDTESLAGFADELDDDVRAAYEMAIGAIAQGISLLAHASFTDAELRDSVRTVVATERDLMANEDADGDADEEEEEEEEEEDEPRPQTNAEIISAVLADSTHDTAEEINEQYGTDESLAYHMVVAARNRGYDVLAHLR